MTEGNTRIKKNDWNPHIRNWQAAHTKNKHYERKETVIPCKTFEWYKAQEDTLLNQLQSQFSKENDKKKQENVQFAINLSKKRVERLLWVFNQWTKNTMQWSISEQEQFLNLLHESYTFMELEFLHILTYFLQRDEIEKTACFNDKEVLKKETWHAFLNLKTYLPNLYYLRKYVECFLKYETEENINATHTKKTFLSSHKKRIALLSMENTQIARLISEEKSYHSYVSMKDNISYHPFNCEEYKTYYSKRS